MLDGDSGSVARRTIDDDSMLALNGWFAVSGYLPAQPAEVSSKSLLKGIVYMGPELGIATFLSELTQSGHGHASRRYALHIRPRLAQKEADHFG